MPGWGGAAACRNMWLVYNTEAFGSDERRCSIGIGYRQPGSWILVLMSVDAIANLESVWDVGCAGKWQSCVEVINRIRTAASSLDDVLCRCKDRND